MHIVFFGDQHLDSLGGAQVSMRLQRRFLERAGHTVSVVAPRMHRAPSARGGGATTGGDRDPGSLDMPSVPVTADREYSLTWPGRRTDRWVDAALAARPPVDLVHVQADFWGAFIGHRYARRHGLPVVHTMHNRVDVGIEATAPAAGLVLRALNLWERAALSSGRDPHADPDPDSDPVPDSEAGSGPGPGASTHDGWAYLRRLAEVSDAVTAPSSHFAHRLEQHGVRPRAARTGDGPYGDAPYGDGRYGDGRQCDGPQGDGRHGDGPYRAGPQGDNPQGDNPYGDGPHVNGPHVDVVWNGIDDDVLDEALADRPARAPGPPRFVWLGRMSPEKRLIPFLEALAVSGVVADVEVLGGGAQLAAARRVLARSRPAATVTFGGRLSYPETLRRMARADAVVQTSIGFETQGMTVFEAATLGTPSIVSDPDIAHELGSGFWAVGGGVDAPPPLADASIPALADALRRAAADIAAGTPPRPNPDVAERFRQSSRTSAMLAIYSRLVR